MPQNLVRAMASVWHNRPVMALAVAATIAGPGAGVVQAAANAVSTEWETGAVAGNAETFADTNASNGQAVRFGAGTLTWADTPSSAVGTSAPLSNWQSTSWNIYAGSTVKVIADATKGKAIQFYGPANQSQNGSQRAEQVPNIADIQPNTTTWVGMDVWLNSGLGIANDWQGLFQLKNDTEGSPTLSVYANAHSDGLQLANNRDNIGTPNFYQSIGATPYGQWTRLVLGMNITKDPTTSWVEVWRDGQNIVPRESWSAFNQANGTGAGGLMYSNASSAYLKFGVYRGPQSWPMDLRMANVKIGSARATVQ